MIKLKSIKNSVNLFLWTKLKTFENLVDQKKFLMVKEREKEGK